ncbi:hypothetical protein [Halomonas sp. BMC6]|uniref:hypothetical protein n=1 Tax=Halomonas sp. BMC6 TaxID=3073244 RepID=UPI0030CC9E32
MNKQALFNNAHRIARRIAAAVGNYMVAFKLALKQAWSDLKMTVTFGIAQNNTRYVEAEAGTVNIGDTFTETFSVEAFEPNKRQLRIGMKATPAATVTRTYTVTGAGKVFPYGDPSNGFKYLQRFYCETQEQRTEKGA